MTTIADVIYNLQIAGNYFGQFPGIISQLAGAAYNADGTLNASPGAFNYAQAFNAADLAVAMELPGTPLVVFQNAANYGPKNITGMLAFLQIDPSPANLKIVATQLQAMDAVMSPIPTAVNQILTKTNYSTATNIDRSNTTAPDPMTTMGYFVKGYYPPQGSLFLSDANALLALAVPPVLPIPISVTTAPSGPKSIITPVTTPAPAPLPTPTTVNVNPAPATTNTALYVGAGVVGVSFIGALAWLASRGRL